MKFEDVLANNVLIIKSIEIVPEFLLPGKNKWYLIDGTLGIEQKFLMQAYIAMCPIAPKFFTPAQSLLAVIATTENIAAINARKRQCISGEIKPSNELYINAVLLTSHMFKHCKSSLLWYHRRWLFESFDLPMSLETEWAIVAQAAQNHPKNYYAWGYLRWCYETLSCDRHAHELLARNVGDSCKQNLSDVSMWTFSHWSKDLKLERSATEIDHVFPGHEAVLAAVISHQKEN